MPADTCIHADVAAVGLTAVNGALAEAQGGSAGSLVPTRRGRCEAQLDYGLGQAAAPSRPFRTPLGVASWGLQSDCSIRAAPGEAQAVNLQSACREQGQLAPSLPIVDGNDADAPPDGGRGSAPDLRSNCNLSSPSPGRCVGASIRSKAGRQAPRHWSSGGGAGQTAADQRHSSQALPQQCRPSPLQGLPPVRPPRVAWDPGPPDPVGPVRPQAAPPAARQALSGWEVGATAAEATPGCRFRTALRRCGSLEQLEALLAGQQGLLPQLSLTVRGGQSSTGSVPPVPDRDLLPTADSLSVRSVCAVFSALPRLPEASTPGGRRRLRELLSRRLGPMVLARRQEMDAGAPAIILQALAALGPEVLDLREGSCELLEALAEAGLEACRLPLDVSGQGQRKAQEEGGRSGHSPRSYSAILWALAKLGHLPDEYWLARYTSASARWLRAFPARDLATCAWALAVMRYRPDEGWLRALLEAWPVSQAAGGTDVVAEQAKGPEAEGSVSTAAAAGPGAARRKPRADAHSLSLMLWALWRLGVAAPGAWLDSALASCAAACYQSASASTASSGPAFPGATCQSVGLIAYSLARMHHTPQPAVRDALLGAAAPLLQRGGVQDLVLLLVGVAHWPRGGVAADALSDQPVPAAWLQRLCEALLPRLPSCAAQALVLALSALAHLGFRPSSAWLEAHEDALRWATIRGEVNGRAAARVMAAWARLRHRPTRNLLMRMLKLLIAGAAAAPCEAQEGVRREPLSARLFAQGLYGAALLLAAMRGSEQTEPALPEPWRPACYDDITTDGGLGPRAYAAGPAAGPASPLPPLLPAMHMRALLAASSARLEAGYLDEALLHLRAWRLLRVAPHHQWLANLAAVARGKLRAAPPGVLLELLRLLAWPGWSRFREQQLAGAGLQRAASGPQQPGELPAEAATAGLRVSASLISMMAARLSAQLRELSPEQQADAAAALADLRVVPGRELASQLPSVLRRGSGHHVVARPESAVSKCL